MGRNASLLWVLCVACALFGALDTWARPVSGTASIRLKKPLSKEISDQVRSQAVTGFKIDLWEWMKEEADVTVDTSNAIQRFHFNAFADSCLVKAKTEQTLVGHDVTVTLAVPGEDARTLLEAYNTKCYSISLRFYTLMKNALEDGAVTDLYNLGIQTIFYTMGRMGTPIGVPDESTPRSFLLEESRKIMQNLFNKFSVRSQEVIISGKPGIALALPITIQTVVDTAPLANVVLAGVLPGGRKLFSVTTGADGSASVADFRIPFVAKGTMLYLKPDLAAVALGSTPFDAGDLGITLPEQTLLFNIIPATVSLSYKATAVNAIAIPKTYSGDAFIKKFLQDSCYVVPAGGKTDLTITLSSQVSSYVHDETEQTVLKVENEITIDDASGKQLSHRQGVAFEKGYENAVQIPYGLFFWEAAARTNKVLKEMIKAL